MLNLFEQMHTILVVAAHPDDEMLGCGGALARLRAAGAKISIFLLGEGPTARENKKTCPKAGESAASAALAAAQAIGISDVHFAALPDNKFDTVPLLDIVKKIEILAATVQPDLVFTHFSGDLNIDHQITQRATLTAFRPLPGCKPIQILGFEVPSSTEYAPPGMGVSFHPNVYIDVADFLEAKQQSLAAYSSELRPWPHPRSHEAVEYLARLRGCQCGVQAAEAFVLYRGIF